MLLVGKGIELVEEFMNLHIAANVGFTVVLFLAVYGTYFLATWLSCRQMAAEPAERKE